MPAALEFELEIVLEACLLFYSQDLVAEHEPLGIISLQVAVDDAIDGHLFHLHLYGNGVIISEIAFKGKIKILYWRLSIYSKSLTIDVKRPSIK